MSNNVPLMMFFFKFSLPFWLTKYMIVKGDLMDQQNLLINTK